mgnify:CR=1 FL=1
MDTVVEVPQVVVFGVVFWLFVIAFVLVLRCIALEIAYQRKYKQKNTGCAKNIR